MKFVSRVVMVLTLLCGVALAQDPPALAHNKFPHPYVGVGLALLPGGYSPVAPEVVTGLTFNSTHFIFDGFGLYDTGKKTNDGSEKSNPKGHDRLLSAFAAYRFHNNVYVGGGGRWSQLSTTNYTKNGSPAVLSYWKPEVGIGYDVFADDQFVPMFARVQVAYLFPQSKEIVSFPNGSSCTTCGNRSQGADISVWFPSPARQHQHLFFKINAVIFQFKDSPTSSTHRIDDSTDLTLLYRF